MLDQLTDLQGKEHILLEANRALSMKVFICAASFGLLNIYGAISKNCSLNNMLCVCLAGRYDRREKSPYRRGMGR